MRFIPPAWQERPHRQREEDGLQFGMSARRRRPRSASSLGRPATAAAIQHAELLAAVMHEMDGAGHDDSASDDLVNAMLT